jgi:hypothetical protein
LAGNSAEFGEFLPVVRFWVENRTKIVPREGDLTAAQEAVRGPGHPADSAASGPVGDQPGPETHLPVLALRCLDLSAPVS